MLPVPECRLPNTIKIAVYNRGRQNGGCTSGLAPLVGGAAVSAVWGNPPAPPCPWGITGKGDQTTDAVRVEVGVSEWR